MPSKRKKNKRRMRKVQVQRRVLEEQHVANLPVKSSTGMVVAAPPATIPKKASKTAAPALEKISAVIPLAPPTVVELEPVEKLLSENNHAPHADVGLKQISAEAEDHVDVELEAPTFAPEATPAPETLPVAPPADETDSVQEAGLVLETEPAIEAAPPAEVPVGAPAELEIQPERKAEPESMHLIFDLETEVNTESQPEEDYAATEEDVSAPTPVQEAAVESAEQDLHSDQVYVEVKPVADDLVSEPPVGSAAEMSDQDPEAVAPREQDEQEKHAAASPAALLSAAKDSLVEAEEIPVVSDKTSEAKEAEAPVTENKKAADGLLPCDVADTETKLTVEAAAFQKDTLTDVDTLAAQTKSVVLPDLDPAEEAPSAAGAQPGHSKKGEGRVHPGQFKTFIGVNKDTAAEQKHTAALLDNPKPEGCDSPCQMQLPVESVQLSDEEISVETALNGHIVPEVSIEG